VLGRHLPIHNSAQSIIEALKKNEALQVHLGNNMISEEMKEQMRNKMRD